VKPEEDPTIALNEIMDEVQMMGSYYLQGKKSMPQLVMQQRAALLMKLKAFIVRRDHEMFNQGVKEGKKK
jgi:hypothetical protein